MMRTMPVPDGAALERFTEMFAQAAHDFEIDYRKTMFCGICEDCVSERRESESRVVM
jgi:hypothetical protein